jgi:hypothetical protein
MIEVPSCGPVSPDLVVSRVVGNVNSNSYQGCKRNAVTGGECTEIGWRLREVVSIFRRCKDAPHPRAKPVSHAIGVLIAYRCTDSAARSCPARLHGDRQMHGLSQSAWRILSRVAARRRLNWNFEFGAPRHVRIMPGLVTACLKAGVRQTDILRPAFRSSGSPRARIQIVIFRLDTVRSVPPRPIQRC